MAKQMDKGIFRADFAFSLFNYRRYCSHHEKITVCISYIIGVATVYSNTEIWLPSVWN